jgi:hypothetical protein
MPTSLVVEKHMPISPEMVFALDDRGHWEVEETVRVEFAEAVGGTDFDLTHFLNDIIEDGESLRWGKRT